MLNIVYKLSEWPHGRLMRRNNVEKLLVESAHLVAHMKPAQCESPSRSCIPPACRAYIAGPKVGGSSFTRSEASFTTWRTSKARLKLLHSIHNNFSFRWLRASSTFWVYSEYCTHRVCRCSAAKNSLSETANSTFENRCAILLAHLDKRGLLFFYSILAKSNLLNLPCKPIEFFLSSHNLIIAALCVTSDLKRNSVSYLLFIPNAI